MVNIKTSILHTLNVKDGQRKAKEATHLHGRLYYTPTVVPMVSSNNSHNNNPKEPDPRFCEEATKSSCEIQLYCYSIAIFFTINRVGVDMKKILI